MMRLGWGAEGHRNEMMKGWDREVRELVRFVNVGWTGASRDAERTLKTSSSS
jgi:hypothetical protein